MAECKINYTWKDFGLSVGMYTGVDHCLIQQLVLLLEITDKMALDTLQFVFKCHQLPASLN